MPSFRVRYLGLAVFVSLCFVILCTITAVSLFLQQAAITQRLRENVSSRRAASSLRECLNILVELEHRHIENLSDLHARAQTHLRSIRTFADQPDEQILYDQLELGFADYLARWQSLPPPEDRRHEAAVTEATRFLELKVLPICREFEAYNDQRVEESTESHERLLRRLSWGMGVVGVLGGIAGVVLGYGISIGLRRSIRRLRVQVRDAAGKLGSDLPDIVLTEQGDFPSLSADVDKLSERIGEVVRRLQQREREVLRAEQLAAVGQLAAGVGHEIRNPLTSIKLLVQSVLEDQNELTVDDFRVIEGEVRRMERSLQTFLDFARPPKAERKPIDLSLLVKEVAELINGRAVRQNVTVRRNGSPGPMMISVDREQLRQVLVNLCLNALEAMPTGGTLTITLCDHGGDRIKMEVADTGVGISPTIAARLFEPFVSSKDTGLGLGLVISKRIVEDHRGNIAVVNNAGGGTSILIDIPKSESYKPSGMI
jgi:two-component system sensor histidine kinase HydH